MLIFMNRWYSLGLIQWTSLNLPQQASQEDDENCFKAQCIFSQWHKSLHCYRQSVYKWRRFSIVATLYCVCRRLIMSNKPGAKIVIIPKMFGKCVVYFQLPTVVLHWLMVSTAIRSPRRMVDFFSSLTFPWNIWPILVGQCWHPVILMVWESTCFEVWMTWVKTVK